MKLFYTLNRDDDVGRYSHIRLAIRESRGKYYRYNEHLELKWQSSPEFGKWYGFIIELSKSSSFIEVREHVKAMGRIEKALSNVDRDNVKAVIDAIHSVCIYRRVYDARDNNEYVELPMLKPSNFKRYMAWFDGANHFTSLSEDAEHAVIDISAAWIDQIAKNGGRCKMYERWVLAGKPVRVDDYARYPQFDTVEEIIKPLGQPKVEEVAA